MVNKFSLSASHYEAIKELSDEQLGKLMRIIFRYANDGVTPDDNMEQVVRIAFNFIKADIDDGRAAYERKCQQNRQNAQKRWAKKTSKNFKKPDKTEDKHPTIDFEKLVAYWNRKIEETGSKMSKVINITSYRKRLIYERLQEYDGNNKALQKVLDMALSDPYLNGANDRHWVADFNWLLRPENFSRLAEKQNPQQKPAPNPVPYTSSVINEEHEISPDILESKEERQKQNILAAIRAAEHNPNSLQARIAYNAYKDGTLLRLGITWRPQTDLNDESENGDRKMA